MSLVDKMVKTSEPKFTNEKARIETHLNRDDTYVEYYTNNGMKHHVFARYYVWKKELQLNMDLFLNLENYFGADRMTMVIDWFNKEFDQDAESVTF